MIRAKTTLVPLLLSSLLWPLACKGASYSAEITYPPPSPERLEEDVAWLADDAREGRRAGTEAALEAGEWIAARMAALGLEPAGEDGYLQRFDVPLEPRTDGGSFAESDLFGRVTEASGRLVPLFCSERGDVEGEMAFVGYGIQDGGRKWDDFAGRELAGRIAIILRGAPPAPPLAADEAVAASAPSPHGDPHAPEGAAAHDDTRIVDPGEAWGGSATIFMKIMNAKRAGARGIVLLPDPAEPAAPLLAFDAGGGARAGIPCVMMAFPEGVDPARLREESSRPPESRGATACSLSGGSTPARVRVFADVVRQSGPATNVLGRLRGTSSERVVVVGAHYDHLGRGGAGSLAGESGHGEIHNGADDNASGTAAVLEIARLLAEAAPAEPLPGDVVFALWSGEELGLLGSEHWIEHPTVPIASVAANLNLDMVGRAEHAELLVLGAGTAEPFAGWLGPASKTADVALDVNPSGDGVGGSDHQTFLKRKIPALHLFSGLHADYHRPSDDVERFEPAGCAKVVALSIELVRDMLGAPQLAFVEPPPSKERKIESGFNAWFGSQPDYGFAGPGVLFGGITGGSPAEKAGLLRGDVLRQLGDVTIDTIYDFTYALQRYKAGDVVLVRYLRDGAEEEVRVTLSSRGLK